MHPILDEEGFLRDFPKLIRSGPGCNFRVTSAAAQRPSCVAYAVGDHKRFWWPDAPFPAVWPKKAPNEETVEAFVAAFGLLGYRRCASAELEPGLEKIAIFAMDGEVQHAAVQPPDRNGWWRSKMGVNVDIDHVLEAIAGPIYGEVVAILSRPRRGRYRLPEVVGR